YPDHCEADPERQQQAEERRGVIHDLARKHRSRPQELPAPQQRLIDALDGLQQSDADKHRLTEELAAYREHFQQLATKLSATRQNAAQKLAKAVTGEIQQLGMPGGQVQVELRPITSAQYPLQGLE